jgi:hypothetical protein
LAFLGNVSEAKKKSVFCIYINIIPTFIQNFNPVSEMIPKKKLNLKDSFYVIGIGTGRFKTNPACFLPICFAICAAWFLPATLMAQYHLEVLRENNFNMPFSALQQQVEKGFAGKDKGKGSGYKQWK